MFDEAPQDTRGTYASFGLHAKRNEEKSKQAGRPIFDDVEYIQILVAGDKNSVIHRPACEQDRRNYAAQYAAFKADKDQDASSGTPLSSVPWITRGQVEEARYLHVKTLEQLAETSDTNLKNFGMGWLQLRQKARDHIATAAGLAPIEGLRAELKERDDRIAALERQVQELVQPKKRGRQAEEG